MTHDRDGEAYRPAPEATPVPRATPAPEANRPPENLALLDEYWRAANYLSVGQIYLMDNPLLTEPLRPEHIKPRLLGHWGTPPRAEPDLRTPQPRDQGA